MPRYQKYQTITGNNCNGEGDKYRQIQVVNENYCNYAKNYTSYKS